MPGRCSRSCAGLDESGPPVTAFEQVPWPPGSARRCGRRQLGDVGVHLALQFRACLGGPGPGSVEPCMATRERLLLAGGVPVFADIDRRPLTSTRPTWKLVLDGRVWGVCLVHQFGMPADLAAFQSLCRRRELFWSRTAATAFEPCYPGTLPWRPRPPTVFGFHPRKMITTGEGGMVLLRDRDAAGRPAPGCGRPGPASRTWSATRRRARLQQDYPEPGYGYLLTELQAALGLVQFAGSRDAPPPGRAGPPL